MYRKVRDNTVTELRLKDGKLAIGDRTELTPTGAGKFSAGERQFIFEGAGFREVTADGETVYERVEPVHPKASELAAFAGVYESPETDAPVTVAVKGEDLMLTVASNAPVKLRPSFRDAFMMRGSSIRFLRDSSGKVTGMSAGDDRAWDIRFTRVGGGR